MKKKALILLVGLLVSATAHSQEKEDLLEWNEFYELSWDDFQAAATPETFGDAGTAVQIKAKPYLVGKEIHYDVKAYFNRKKSWARDRSPSLLSHERLHFDIAELYARKIRKKIRALADQGNNDPAVYNEAIKKLLMESNHEDERYDKETLHGALQERQRIWEKEIRLELKHLERFKKEKRVVGARRLKKQPLIF